MDKEIWAGLLQLGAAGVLGYVFILVYKSMERQTKMLIEQISKVLDKHEAERKLWKESIEICQSQATASTNLQVQATNSLEKVVLQNTNAMAQNTAAMSNVKCVNFMPNKPSSFGAHHN